MLLPGRGALAPEAILSCYDGWARDEMVRSRKRGAGSKRRGLVLTRAVVEDGTVDQAVEQ